MGRARRILALAMAASLLAAACGGGDDSDDDDAGGDPSGDGTELPACPLDALDDATEPVEIVYWHGMTRVAEDTLKQLTDEFNGSQNKVRVKLVNNSSEDQHDKYLAGLSTGDLPDVIQHDSTLLQQMVDTQTVVPAQSCIDAMLERGDKFTTDDWVQRALGYYQLDGVQWTLPFAVANPVLVYNKAAFEKAGLDPEEPPATLDDYRAAAQALVDAGYKYGAAVAIEAWHFEEYFAVQGESYVDQGNGRDGRATEVTFDSAAGEELYGFFEDLVDDGLAVTNPRTGPDALNNLFAIGNGDAAMTVVSSSSIGSVLDVLGSGRRPVVDGPRPLETGRGVGVHDVPDVAREPGGLGRSDGVRAGAHLGGRSSGDRPAVAGGARPAHGLRPTARGRRERSDRGTDGGQHGRRA